MSAKGMKVVVDTVNDNDERFNTCLGLLIDHPVLFVGVTCSKASRALSVTRLRYFISPCSHCIENQLINEDGVIVNNLK